MNKKITITPNKEVWQFLKFFSIVFLPFPATIGLITFFSSKHDNPSYMIVGWLLIEVILLTLTTSYCMQNCKTYVFTENGLIVKLWKYEKKYCWNELKIKKIENNTNSIYYRYTEGIVLSTKKVKSTILLSTHERYSLIHFFTPLAPPFFVDFKEKDPKTRLGGSYRVEKTTFLADLSSIGVEID